MARILKTGLIALALLATPLAARAEINRLRAAQNVPATVAKLPIRMLVWQDKQGRTWIGYVPPAAMARRRGVPTDHPVIRRMGKALDAVAREAAR